MFILRKLLLSMIGFGFAFVISSCHDAKKKLTPHLEKTCKEKTERHHRRW